MAYVLVMDDDEAVRDVMVRVLKNEGHEVSAFANAEEGVAAVSRGSYSLVVTDILMPGTTGIDAILQLRGILPTIPILAVSGGGEDTEESYLELASKLGANKVLAKPFTTDQFKEAVQELLGT
jgi:CheY-like chemotaxis protein